MRLTQIIMQILSLFILSFLTLCFSLDLFAQVDTTYIKKHELPLSVKVSIGRNNVILTENIYNKESGKEEVKKEYRDNQPINMGLNVSTRGYSLGFSMGINALRSKKKGKTKSLQFNYLGYKRSFIYDIYLQSQKGFYQDSDDKESYLLEPNASIKILGGSFLYIFNNKRFSYKAAFQQSEIQAKSQGSFLLGGNIFYSKVNTEDSSISFESISKQEENLQFGIQGGYAYSWAFNAKLLLLANLNVGANIGNNRINKFFKTRMHIYPILNARLSLSHNDGDISYAVTVVANKHWLSKNKYLEMGMHQIFAQFSFTKRFNFQHKLINRTANKVDSVKKKLRL